MISIIICSTNRQYFEQVAESIEKTIGVTYEIIKIDNSLNQSGICKAYNDGAAQANFPFLCFLHEDVLFETTSWGEKLIHFFSNNVNVGAIGIAGSKYKSLVPSVWAQGLFATDHIYIKQGGVGDHIAEVATTRAGYEEVKTLDGVFLFTKKDVWQNNNFDEKTFDKFHCYDLDFSLQVGQTAKLYVCYEVLLVHLSGGKLNKDWVNYSIKLSDKWKNILPVGSLTKPQQKEIEWRNRKIFFLRMNIVGFPITRSLKVFFSYNFFENFSLIKTIQFVKDMLLRILKVNDKPFY